MSGIAVAACARGARNNEAATAAQIMLCMLVVDDVSVDEG